MKKLFSSLFLVLLSLVTVGRVVAQDGGTNLMYTEPGATEPANPGEQDLLYDKGLRSIPESHSYTYSLKEDGSAVVWLRVDGVPVPEKGGEYHLILPENVTGEVLGWYRDYGCAKYDAGMCIWEGNNAWKKTEIKRNGNEIFLKIPDLKPTKLNREIPMNVGISWNVPEATTKKWWGREVAIKSAVSDEFVQYLTMGIYLPQGVYGRDKQQGPSGWGRAMNEMMGTRNVAMDAPFSSKMASASMLDLAGSGQISRTRNNLTPREEYKFSLMSSTSVWKLYVSEMAWGVVWIFLIAIVLTLLMYMVIGRKSFWWYGALVLLIMTLLILVGGLWVSYRYTVGGGEDPIPLYKNMEVSSPDAAAVDSVEIERN